MIPERQIVALLRELASERGIEFSAFSQDWILRLRHRDVTRWVFGYDFDLNSCCAQILSKDKAGASLLLDLAGVPCVPHVLFNSPENMSFAPDGGTWSAILECASRFGFDVVCKPNEGSGGVEVTRARGVVALERAVHALFARARAIALSPFLELGDEYRAIVLAGRCRLAYRKVRPTIVGDGSSSRAELITRKLCSWRGSRAGTVLIDLVDQKVDLSEVLPEGQVWPISWKHNLGLGAAIELLGRDWSRLPAVEALAVAAARALNLQFGSVDVVEEKESSSLRVLEVNAGVMMESFAASSPEARGVAKAIYGAAVDVMFG